MMYPLSNRRIRSSPHLRKLTQEVNFNVGKLIQPLFVVEGIKERQSIPGLTGVYRDNETSLLKQVEKDLENGVNSFLLFGVPAAKSEKDFNYDFTANQLASLKGRFGKDVFLSVDVCLCSYTTHGHCGILNDANDHVVNHLSVQALANAALAYAQGGADCVAPSDMMDHRIRAIRQTLDNHSKPETLIMSYSAKFHSGFYGPFRAAADSAPKGDVKIKDRATYQIDPAHPSDAYRCSVRDMEEGADILMVKPGLPYLDVLADLSKRIPLPWAVYEVSGEFAAIELMQEKGLVDGKRAHLESWTAFFRAGAEMV
ncbi:MAG: porphobilinogen synthase, partial [Bdellovibrionales bacterium]|nr:porphobilinogen synthase [Oligoflexia bacterium]